MADQQRIDDGEPIAIRRMTEDLIAAALLPHPAVTLENHLAAIVPSASKRKSIVAAVEAYIRHVIDEVKGESEPTVEHVTLETPQEQKT